MPERARSATSFDWAGEGDAPVGPETDDLPAILDERDLETAAGRIAEGREEIDGILTAIKERFTLGHLAQAASDTLSGTTSRATPGSKGLLLAVCATGFLLLGFGVLSRLRTKGKRRRKEDRFSRFSAFPQKSV